MTWLGFPEERAPCGAEGVVPVYLGGFFDEPWPADPLGGCLTARPQPWLLVLWEPLLTKAPSPPKAAPYCCYRNTVIFYHSPHIVRPWKRRFRVGGQLQACRGGFEEWDQIRTRLMTGDKVDFEGDRFEVQTGRVVWAQRRWWMRHGARREAA